MVNRNADVIRGLRELADFLESWPECPGVSSPNVNIWLPTEEDAKPVMAAFAKHAGHVEKHFLETTAYLRKKFAGNVWLDINANRNAVCERVQVGTRIVPAQPERVLPATEDKEEPVFEWQCGSFLAAPEEGGAQ